LFQPPSLLLLTLQERSIYGTHRQTLTLRRRLLPRLDTVTNANGSTATYGYDAAHRLTQVLNKTSGLATISQHDYTLDAVGNRTALDEVLAPAGGGSTTTVNRTYGYDKLNRLTSETRGAATTLYGYDAAGNRTSAGPSGSSTTYTYDKADRITAAGSTSYTVNANGNLTARGSADAFAYDQANRLTTVTIGTSASGSYSYDGDGNRVGRSWASSGSTGNAAYVHDVNRGLPVVIDDGTNKYVWTVGLAYSVNKSTGAVTTYHRDGLGSVRALTNASQGVTDTFETDAWGKEYSSSGSTAQPYSFTGEPRDKESNFYQLRARSYDPNTGRFLSQGSDLAWA
jgi:YD repeat-containing protein